MSSIVGAVGARSGQLRDDDVKNSMHNLIHHGTFTFNYGGATTSCNYTLPTGTGLRQWYRLLINFSDYRWNSECVVFGSSDYFGTGGNLYNHWNTIQVTTGGVVNCANGNGGTGGPFTAELRVWEVESPHLTNYIYSGGN